MDDLANSLRPSRLVSSIAQSPALPWEVIERAIDLCSGDKATLCAFALTCSQLHPRSLFVLFTNVDLRSLKQLVAFYHAVQAQSHLQPVVKSLSFPWGDLSESPFPLLSILPGLRNVTFNSIYPVIRDDIQLSQSTLLCGLQSLTIRDAVFRTQTAFLRFLSAFPNIEDLTCESLHLIIHEGSGIVQDHPSCRLQLRTLNILQDVDQHVAELLVHIAQPAITSPPAVPEPARQDRQTSLTWWTPVGPKRLHHAIGVLRGSPRAIRHVTLVLWDSDVGSLHRKCCRPANLELFATLESVLLEYNCHRVLLTVPGIPVLKKRKTISWSDEFSKCFRPVSEKWALTEDVRYSGECGHDSYVTALVVSSDGRWVATASEDSTIILWDAHDAHISQEWLSRDGELLGLAFSPDSRHLASAGGDGNVTIWDISRSSYRVAVLEGHSAPVLHCAWSIDGAYIASSDHTNTLRLRDGQSFQLLPVDGTTIIEPLFSPDSQWLLVHNWDSCGVWDVVSRAYLALRFQLVEEGAQPVAAAFNPSSTHVAVGYWSGMIHIWCTATGQEPLLFKAHQEWVNDVVFSPDGRLLLSASSDKTVKIWDARTGAMVQALDGHPTVYKACFSPCGKYIASASADKTVRVWRTSDGSCLATLSDHGAWVQHVAFTTDGTMLWSAAHNGTVLGRRLQDIVPKE